MQIACLVWLCAQRVMPGSTSRLPGLGAVPHVRVSRLQCQEQGQSVVARVYRDTRDRAAVHVFLVHRARTRTFLGVQLVSRVELMRLVHWEARLSRIVSLRALLGRRDLTGHARLVLLASTRRPAGAPRARIVVWVLILRRWGRQLYQRAFLVLQTRTLHRRARELLRALVMQGSQVRTAECVRHVLPENSRT